MNRRAFVRATAGLLTAGTATTVYGSVIEPRQVEFTAQPHALPVPPGVRIAQLSDLHFTHMTEAHERIVEELQRWRPSVVLLTGDSVNGNPDLPALDEFLAQLPAAPVFAVFGNWERWGRTSTARFARMLESRGGRLLVDRSVLHEDVLYVGLDDLVGGRPDPGAALRAAPDSAARVLLAHCPLQRDRLPAEARPFDLVLSGHTHGGQIRPFGWAPVTPRGSGSYVAGWYRGQGPPLYVSRGVGTSVVPVRIGARPEVVLLS